MENWQGLYQQALQVRNNAYAPYSHFAVGACLLAADGSTYVGCNVENGSYGICVCAERNAITTAVAQGVRHFAAIAVVGGPQGVQAADLMPCLPCGICLQTMQEFCAPDFVVLVFEGGKPIEYTLQQLLPHAFAL